MRGVLAERPRWRQPRQECRCDAKPGPWQSTTRYRERLLRPLLHLLPRFHRKWDLLPASNEDARRGEGSRSTKGPQIAAAIGMAVGAASILFRVLR
jgi:hypothetical protein